MRGRPCRGASAARRASWSRARSRCSRTRSRSTSCSACSRCCWCSSRLRSASAPEGGAASAVRALLTELIPFGGDTLAVSLRQLRRLARGFELLSLALIVWGSSGIFVPVEMALDRAWGGRQPRVFWKSRLLALLLTVSAGALALVSVALTVATRGLGHDWPLATAVAVKAAAVLLTWSLFVIVYRLAPSARVDLRTAATARGLGGGAVGAVEVRLRLEPRSDAARHAVRAARVRRVAGAVGVRLEPRARVRRRGHPGSRQPAPEAAFRRRPSTRAPRRAPSPPAGRAAGGGRA